MSDQQNGLERATLDAKDRAELASIAEALGQKPPSRARKSAIVDLILQLAGVEDSDGAPAAATDDAPAASHDGTSDEPAGSDNQLQLSDANPSSGEGRSNQRQRPVAKRDESNSAASESSSAQNSGDAQSRDAQSRDAQSNDGQSDEASSDSQAGSGSNNGGSNGSTSNRKSGGSQRPKGEGQSRSGSPQRGGSSGSDAGSDNDADDDEGDGQSDDHSDQNNEPEPGNRRRRRRRGRDRDRDTDPEWSGEPIEVEGLLDLRDDGYGFLRVKGFLPSRDDVYVSVKQCRQLGLRKGDHVAGLSRPAGRQEKNPALMRVERVNGLDPEQARDRVNFDELAAVSPSERLLLTGSEVSTTSGRIVDLIAPLGKGQRGIIATPPHSNKSALLRDIAQCIESNNPDASLLVLLVDEKPEEVSEFERVVDGDVLASTFDRPGEEHVTVAELTLEHARRLVEYGNDVVILLDGLTRLVRGYGATTTPSGRTLGGTLDTAALYPAKWFFGSARSVEGGGSLTIIATAEVENGSSLDAEIFHEFSANANFRLVLNRRLAERRVSPAIDMAASGTDNDELLLTEKEAQNISIMRRLLEKADVEGHGEGSLEELIEALAASKDNDTFVKSVQKR